MTPTEQQLCDAFGKAEPCDGIREMARCFDAAGIPVPDDADDLIDSDDVRLVYRHGPGMDNGLGYRLTYEAIGQMFGESRSSVVKAEQRAFDKIARSGLMKGVLSD